VHLSIYAKNQKPLQNFDYISLRQNTILIPDGHIHSCTADVMQQASKKLLRERN